MVDVVVVGGGAIGAAIARELTKRSKSVALLEKLSMFGMDTSSRSSEVIHRGIYYPKNTLKSTLCIDGRERLLAYLKEKSLPHNICGKLIVASSNDSDVARLRDLFDRCMELGLSDLSFLSAEDAASVEPEVVCSAAIWSPYTGVFDSRAVLDSFICDIQTSSTDSFVSTNCEVTGITKQRSTAGYEVNTTLGPIIAREGVVLSPGLYSSDAISRVHGFPGRCVPASKYAKGYYFRLRVKDQGPQPFKHLVYPLPEVGGLGIHSTLNLNGEVRFGPNVEWLGRESLGKFPDYSFPEDTRPLEIEFRRSIAKYWPAVDDHTKYSLLPDYTGIRPKVELEGQYPDFVVLGSETHGMKGLVCLMGMESPGWTSSLAIANFVANKYY